MNAELLNALQNIALGLMFIFCFTLGYWIRGRKWQPIETAPKHEGVSILTFGRLGHHFGPKDEEEKTFSVSRWCESRYPAGGFWVSMEPQDHYFEPTHWMPLPPLPEVKK